MSRSFRPVGAATPFVEATAGAAAAALFATTSALRGARTFHPIGAAFAGTFVVDQPAHLGTPLLDRPGRHRAIVRLSRGVGTQEPAPDVLGLAVRILDAHGPGDDQDLLLVTSGERPVARHLFVPTVGFDGARFSSVLPYRIGERHVLLGARLADPGTDRVLLSDIERGTDGRSIRFSVDIADPTGPWQPVAELVVDDRLPDETSDGLRFDPSNSGGGIEPIGFFQALRRLSYRASQAARPH